MIHSCSLIQDYELELKKSKEYFIEVVHIISPIAFSSFIQTEACGVHAREIVYLAEDTGTLLGSE